MTSRCSLLKKALLCNLTGAVEDATVGEVEIDAFLSSALSSIVPALEEK